MDHIEFYAFNQFRKLDICALSARHNPARHSLPDHIHSHHAAEVWHFGTGQLLKLISIGRECMWIRGPYIELSPRGVELWLNFHPSTFHTPPKAEYRSFVIDLRSRKILIPLPACVGRV